MMHSRRCWCLQRVDTTEVLAKMLTETTWTLCSGFTVAGHEEYLFLNDATCEDGAAEFAVVKHVPETDEYLQVESITFSWCDFEKGLRYVREVLAGRYDRSDFSHPVHPRLQTPEQHGRCHLCA
jgi:hypothetical protein